MSSWRNRAWHRCFGESHDARPVYSVRTRCLLIVISLVMSLAMWHHVRNDDSIDAAIREGAVEEDFEDFEDYGACEMPGPCWGENPPVDCECY